MGQGVIDLDNVTRVSMVKASGKYKGVSDESCLFEIELPNRIYPCTAESAEMVSQSSDRPDLTISSGPGVG